MLQELFDRWVELQKPNSETQSIGSQQDRIAEELNILEALRLLNCKAIPGETSDIHSLIKDRHRQMEETLRKRKA
jgi:hypothetical protein